MRRVLTILLAVALLVGGGVAFALLGDSGAAVAQEDTIDKESPATEAPVESTGAELERPERGAVLSGVLADLVADGVITQDQADEITAALQARIEELRAEFRERRGELEFDGRRFLRQFDLRELLEDGVIDSDELAELGEDHPFNDPDGPAAEYLDDGQLTQEELDELHAGFGPHGSGRDGRGFGGSDDADGSGDTGG